MTSRPDPSGHRGARMGMGRGGGALGPGGGWRHDLQRRAGAFSEGAEVGDLPDTRVTLV